MAKQSKQQTTPKLGKPNYTMLGKSATASTEPKKLTGPVLESLYQNIRAGRNSFRVDGQTYTVAGLSRKLKPIMTPSDHRRLLAGDELLKIRPPTAGSGRMDVIFADDGALVSKKKRNASKTNNKKSRTGATKYACGLFK